MSRSSKASNREYKQRYYKRWTALEPHELNCWNAQSPLNAVAIRSQTEVGKMLGISRQAVHQLERKALNKLRQGLRQEWLAWKETQ